MSKWELFLQFLQEGREWLKVLIPALITLHLPQPKYMKKKCDKPDCGAKDG